MAQLATAHAPPQQPAAAARRCFACGAPAVVTVACSAGRGGADAEECARCGYWEAPALPRRAIAFTRPQSSSDSARTPSPPLLWHYAQNSDLELELALARSLADAALDLGHMPPLSAAARGHSRADVSPSSSSTVCLACSPARRCGAHSRLAPGRLAARRVPEGAPPGAAVRPPLHELTKRNNDADSDGMHKSSCSSYCATRLDASERARVMSAAAAAAAAATRAVPPSVAAIRRALSGGADAAKAPLAPRLDTAWHTEAADPRARWRAMAAAGWARCGSGRSDGHPRWERTLQEGHLMGTRQVLCFSSSTSDALHAWHNQSGDLARADRVARSER
jgi:hypothetical protein